MTKCQKDPTCDIFLKRRLFKDIKNYIPMCQTHKYKNTNTQIHKYTSTQIQHIRCQKDPTHGIVLKRGFSESSMYHLCIVSASSVHHQRIISASSAHHQRIISISLMHHQYIISASRKSHLQCTWSSFYSYIPLIKLNLSFSQLYVV